jgi:hypothetical protein
VGTLHLALLEAIFCAIILYFPVGLMQFIDWIDNQISRLKIRKATYASKYEKPPNQECEKNSVGE